MTANARRAMGRATVALPHIPPAQPTPPADDGMPGQHSFAVPSADPAEDSGSLTGAVLRRGLPDEPSSRPRTLFVFLTIAGAVLMLVAFGVIVVALTGDAVGSFFDSLVG